MHQKQPPAKIAVSDAAARPGSGPEPAASAASKRAAAAATIHRAIMEVSRLNLAAEHKNAREARKVALARP